MDWGKVGGKQKREKNLEKWTGNKKWEENSLKKTVISEKTNADAEANSSK